MAEQNGAGTGAGGSLAPAAAAPTLDVQQASTSASQVAFAEQKKPERQAPAALPLTRVPTSDRPKEGGSGKGKTNEQAVTMDEHLLTVEELAARYKTSVNVEAPGESLGLASAEAQERLEQNGLNRLTPPKEKSALMVFLGYLCNLFNLLLLVSGVLNYLLIAVDPIANQPSIIYGSILVGVALLNAAIEYYQEAKSAAILKGFLNLIPANATAMRDGKLSGVPAQTLVVGDVVFARLGDKVPADLALFHTSEMKVDNSSLTGESEPQERKGRNTTGAQNPLEAPNLAFNGTLVVAGEGYGVVVRTGDNTVLGQIAGMTQKEKKNPSPMSMEIDHLVKITAAIAIFFAVVFFGISFTVYSVLSQNINFAIGVLVAFVPQGLPATVTMLLTIAAKRMSKKNVLIKDLQGVETLGAITLLATDKTGTLTRNQMTVTNVWTCMQFYSATKSAADKGDPFTPDLKGGKEILEAATLNTRARWDRTDIPVAQRQILGDATETGLMRWASTTLPGYENYHTKYPKIFEIPFNSDNKWAMTIHKKPHETGEFSLYQKGAPERILRLCKTIYINGAAVPLTDEHRNSYNQAYEYLASTGQRVLAFAQALLPSSEYPSSHEFDREKRNYPTDTLTFLGLVSLEDPPKHGVREAIGRCRSAGIQIIMVTGDHPLTAEAIGRKINMMISETKQQMAMRRGIPVEQIDENEVDAVVVHGEQIDEFDDHDWDLVFSKTEVIFARTSPKHKLTIVKRAQSMGHIVGVTGDGVNDSPALKKADLGIAMNLSGSDVSKEAAAMILLDDNFASVVNGIEQGRLIFLNLKKSITYTITHTLPELMAVLLFVVVPLPMPISAMLILLIDLGFELALGLSFAWDVPESRTGLLKMLPRKPVTYDSIARLRKRKEREAKRRTELGYKIDEESGEEASPGMFTVIKEKLATPFRGNYWKEKMEKTDDEVLVDGNVLSYAYLEMGIIETLSAIAAFFAVFWVEYGLNPTCVREAQIMADGQFGTADTIVVCGRTMTTADQTRALAIAQGAYYLSIMVNQVCNSFVKKARLRLPFGKFMVANPISFLATALAGLFAFFIVYTPGVRDGLLVEPLQPFWIILIPLGFCVVQILYVTLRVIVLRIFAPEKYNPDIEGLQMYPTVRSARSGRSGRH